MTQQLKYTIAKEIIVFFSGIAFSGIILSGYWCVNQLKVREVNRLEEQAKTLSISIDSIKTTFPERVMLFSILDNGVPKEAYVDDQMRLKRIGKQSFPSNDVDFVKFTLSELYPLLKISEYNFVDFGKFNGVPTYEVFVKQMLNAIKNCNPKGIANGVAQPEIENIFKHLKNKQFIRGDYNLFVTALKYPLPPPPPRDVWLKVNEEEIHLDKINSEKQKVKTGVMSPSYLINKWKSIILIVFLMLYPVRFAFLMLRWAFKTLRC